MSTSVSIENIQASFGNPDEKTLRVRRRVIAFMKKRMDIVLTTSTIARETRQSEALVAQSLSWLESRGAIKSLGEIATRLTPTRQVAAMSQTWVANGEYYPGKYVAMVQKRYTVTTSGIVEAQARKHGIPTVDAKLSSVSPGDVDGLPSSK